MRSKSGASSTRTLAKGLGWLCLAVVLACAGCRSRVEHDWQTAAVSGTVTINGKPLENGTVRFVPTGATLGPKTTLEIHDGKFAAEAEHGPTLGCHRVEIEYAHDSELAHDDEDALTKLKGRRLKPGAHPILPAVYNTQSRLTAIIEETMQPLDFPLRSK